MAPDIVVLTVRVQARFMRQLEKLAAEQRKKTGEAWTVSRVVREALEREVAKAKAKR